MRILVAAIVLTSVACAASAPQARSCARDLQPSVVEAATVAAANANVVAPVVVRRVEPLVGRGVPSPSTATVEAVIGTDGVPRGICVVSGDVAWGRALAEAVRQWQFRPGTLDGQPVEVLFSLTADYRGH